MSKVKTKRLTIVTGLCTGCGMCELMCSLEKTGEVNPYRSRIRVAYDSDGFSPHPIVCRHCKRPPCLPVCPEPGAMRLEDGVVVIDESKCTRCLLCIDACPFGAIFLSPDGQVLKCDLCGGDPVCVKFCPLRPEYDLPGVKLPKQSCLQYSPE